MLVHDQVPFLVHAVVCLVTFQISFHCKQVFPGDSEMILRQFTSSQLSVFVATQVVLWRSLKSLLCYYINLK